MRPALLTRLAPALIALSSLACPSPGGHTVQPTPLPTKVESPADAGGAVQAVPSPDPAPAPEAALLARCRKHLEAAKTHKIALLGGGRVALHTLGVWNDIGIELDNAAAYGSLLAAVHPDKPVRDAGDQCVVEVQAFSTELYLDRAVYDVLAAVSPAGLDADATRVLTLTLRDFRRAGVDKDEPTRQRLKEIDERMTAVAQQFDRNIREDDRQVELDPAQLAGLPQDWIDAHPVNDKGKVVVTTAYPDYVPMRTYASDDGARRALYMAYLNRGWPKNDEVFKELLTLRLETAKLLGYASWADLDAEVKMIKKSKAIIAFVDKIAKASEKAAKRDYQVLLARKKKDAAKASFVDGSEFVYYEDQVRRDKYALDSQEVRKYFDFEKTQAGLLSVTGQLFGLEYKPVTDAEVWHADVDVYDVYQGGEKMGRIYLDLHPREGKYSHAAQFTLVSGVAGRQLPEGVLVCNFGRGLLDHGEVVTMFHEFGHLMHHVLAGRHKWVRFSGVKTEWDFVEAPSQLLEEWAWDAGVLATFATDAAGKPIPAELVAKMRAAKEFGKGYFARTQMFYAGLSYEYHVRDPKGLDPTAVAKELQKKYSVFPYVEGTHFQASFGHLNGYSSGYYTYMWSQVIAKDLFSAFEKAGLMDAATATRYRDMVLAPGGSKDAADLVKDFLGREYGFDSFKKWLDRT